MSKKIRVTLVKSPIGYEKSQKATVRALGLRRLNSSAVHNDTPPVRGMINKIIHLVKVEEVDT
jgi:large subunit ribosomal protein L30